MEFLRELIKLDEGFGPDYDSMSNADLMSFCREHKVDHLCEVNAKGKLTNRGKLVQDLEAGKSLDADIKRQGSTDESYGVNVEKDISTLYQPVIKEADSSMTNKTAKQAVEDKIGNKGMKGMRKKDRPYMEKPSFRDWLTSNMYFKMTKSGKLAGKMDKE